MLHKFLGESEPITIKPEERIQTVTIQYLGRVIRDVKGKYKYEAFHVKYLDYDEISKSWQDKFPPVRSAEAHRIVSILSQNTTNKYLVRSIKNSKRCWVWKSITPISSDDTDKLAN